MTAPAPALPPQMVDDLRKAFEAFQGRAQKLEEAYRAMQEDFKKVNLELDRTNAELRQSLRAQEETQTYLTSILQSMDNGVIGIDTLGAVTHFNRAAAEITGYDAGEVLGREYRSVFQREAESDLSLLRVVATGKGLQRDEKVIWGKDGHPVPVSFQTAVLRDQDGGPLGAVEIFSDVSRIKALEEEMQRTKTMAALGEMAATVAHEIRNPLGAMGVWAGLLERDLTPDDPRRKTVSRIIEGLSRLNRIVSNLLVYSRPVKASLRKVDLRSVLDEIVDFVEVEVERQGTAVQVHKQWSGDDPVMIQGDPEKLHQVVLNLCLNAVQAMPQGGALTVRIDPPSPAHTGYVSFSVRDTGIGISPDALAKIFDPFYTTKENGTGLGLAIVKKVVEFHSGHTQVESTVGAGTSVRVFIPRIRERLP